MSSSMPLRQVRDVLSAPTISKDTGLLPSHLYVDSLKIVQEELKSLKSSLELSARLGTTPRFTDLLENLHSGELARTESTMHGADVYIVEQPLEEWEAKAWSGMGYEDAPMGYRKLSGPFERPNELLCAVFSCFNDPRQPPSTNFLLSLKLFEDGLKMGSRGDARISAEGLVGNVEDLEGKLGAYIRLVAENAAAAQAP